MSDVSERYRKVATQFTDRVRAVPADAWDNASPCEGWTARDVVDHVVTSTGFFLGRAGIELPAGPPAGDDPAAAWERARGAMQSALDSPDVASAEYETPMGRATLEQTVGQFGVGDVLVHTWDLARATGQDETLDPQRCALLLEGMQPLDELLRSSGQFGPKVEVPGDADIQARMLAFIGRDPS